MSFKDVRDFAEHLKLLGFPKVFPLTALATNHGSLASFYIVAEVLCWLAELLEPGTNLPGSTDTEEERVILIRSATEFFVSKSAIKLNPRKLYAASSITANELQKITRLLITPALNIDADQNDEDQQYRSLNQVDIGDKIDDLRRARELSSDLTQRGASLYDLLSKEMVNKEARLAQANRPMELASVERSLKNAIAATQVKLQSGRLQLENARVEFNALSSKLQRKRAELERTKQRLEALQKIRPAHMQEFEDCEKELRELFHQYFLRIHVRDALRAQMEVRTKRLTPVTSPLLQKPADSSMPFIPEGLTDDDDDDDVGVLNGGLSIARTRGTGFGLDNEIPDIRDEDLVMRDNEVNSSATAKRPGTATSRIRPTTGRSRVRPNAGSSLGRSNAIRSVLSKDDDEDSSFGSSDSDLDMGGVVGLGVGAGGVVDGNNPMLGNMATASRGGLGVDDFDLNSMEDMSISKLTGELPLRPKTANKQEQHSDEDF